MPRSSATTRPPIFISYARGDDEDFVRRLHDDLTARGFDVWFDRVSLPSRQLTFHHEIKDAIRERDRLVYVAGPKAAVSDYVREEWRFALESDKPVIPILRRGDYDLVPGALGLLHCEDFRDDAAYRAQLAKLVANLERPEPPLGRLYAVPDLPRQFLARPDLLRSVKDALLVDLQQPVVITGAAARVGVQGMGGIGKSVLAVALARDREVRRAYHDGVVWVSVGQTPDLAQLQRDVVTALGGEPAFENDAQGLGVLRELLLGKAVLLVLDDVWAARHASAFDALGPSCRALVTTRDAGILHTLQGELVQVDLLSEDESLRLLAESLGSEPAALPTAAREVVRECGCLPLALALCAGMVAKRAGDWSHVLERLRRAQLEKIADRHAIAEQHRSIWRAMQVSVEALSEDQQQRFAELSVFRPDQATPEAAVATLWSRTGGLDDLDTDELLVELAERSLIRLDLRESPWQVSLHTLLFDYATRTAGGARELNERLVDAYRTRCTEEGAWQTGPNDGYFLQNLGWHLAAAGRGDEYADLMLRLEWLETQNAAGLVFGLPDAFEKAHACAPDHPQRRLLPLLSRALQRDLHFIHAHREDYPQALFQCMWNQAWWHDCPQVEQHYEVPEGGWTPENAAWLRVGLKVYKLLQEWRRRREDACAGFPWVRSLRPPPSALDSALLAVLRGHEDKVESVAFSSDGTRIVSGSWDNTVRVWDARTGAAELVLRGHEAAAASVAFSSDGTRIVSGSGDRTVRVWDARTCATQHVLHGHQHYVTSVAFSSDGTRIVSGSGDRTVRVWDARTGAADRILRGHEGVVIGVAFSSDGTRIVTGSADNTVRVWDARTGALEHVLRGHERAVTSVTFSSDSTRIVSGSADNTVRVWDARTGALEQLLRGHEHQVQSVAFSSADTHIVSGSYDHTVRVWDVRTGAAEHVSLRHEDMVTSVASSSDGTRIVSGSWDNTVRVWDARTNGAEHVLRGHGESVRSVAFSSDGTRIVSGSYDASVRVWDARTGAAELVLRGHDGTVWSVAFSSDGTRIVSGGFDTVRVWDARTGAAELVLRGHEVLVVDIVAFSSDGTHIASGSKDGTVRVWDARTGALEHVLRGHEGEVTSVTFSSDSTRIVSGSDDNTVRVWDARTGAPEHVLRLHEMGVTSVAFSSDDTRIVSGSRDHDVRVWDAHTGAVELVLRGHERAVTSVVFSSSDKYIISTSRDETVRVWDPSARLSICLAATLAAQSVVDLIERGGAVFGSGPTAGSSCAFVPAAEGATWHLPAEIRFASRTAPIYTGSAGKHLIIVRLEGVLRPEPGRDLTDPWEELLRNGQPIPDGAGALEPIELDILALDKRRLGQLAEAENLLTRAIRIEDARLAIDAPERPHRRNNLAMVLLRAGRLDEASALNANAWHLRGSDDATDARVLFVRIALELLRARPFVDLYLGQLKTLLSQRRHNWLRDIERTWYVPDVVEALREQLPSANLELLAHIARAVNGERLAVLKEIPAWAAIEMISLSTPWPDETTGERIPPSAG